MKLAVLCAAVALTAASLGVAHATPVTINNADFSQVTFGSMTPAGTEVDSINRVGGGQNVATYVTVDGWQVNGNASTGGNPHAQAIWFANANAALNGPGGPLLADVVAPPSGSGSFVGLNGDTGGAGNGDIHANIQQQLFDLVPGTHYVVSFDWAASQQAGVHGPTTEFLRVSLGGQSYDTDIFSIPNHGFEGWQHVSFGFTANSASEWLSFMSFGTPTGLPPMALLTNVSMGVPEPPVLALFGGGLLGLGFLAFCTRRRERRADGASA